MVVRVPALATGAAVGTQVENSSVTENDPTSSGIAAPLGSLAGQVGASRQLVDFSRPSIDDVLTDEEVGSGTATVRFSAYTDAALIVLNVKAVAKVTGGTPPSGF
jgi:hypothetical protein